MNDILKGFSKLSREEKTRRILDAFSSDPQQAARTLHNYLHADPALETLHEGFAENTLANYYLPFCIAPNFRINGRMYAVPMVIEESSVVAACPNRPLSGPNGEAFRPAPFRPSRKDRSTCSTPKENRKPSPNFSSAYARNCSKPPNR